MSKQFTKDGVEVKVGQIWQYLDIRMDGRRLRVVEVFIRKQQDWIGVKDIPSVRVERDAGGGRKQPPIAIARMHRYGQGFRLVKDIEP